MRSQRRAMGLSGLVAAPFTPLKDNGSLCLGQIETQAEQLIKSGVVGSFICGTTGEGLSLSIDERRSVAEAWRKACGKELALIVHVGHTSIVEAEGLARHAQAIGVDATAATMPSQLKPACVDDLVAWCKRVAQAAEGLPFYYYHIPSLAQLYFPMDQFLRLAVEQIPNFGGIKYTSEDLMEFQHCLQIAGDNADILYGRDEMLLSALAVGATAAVGSTYNYAAPLYHRVIEAFSEGDLAAARRAQVAAIDLVRVVKNYGGLPAGKAIMSLVGIDCGPVRPPLRSLSPETQALLRTELEEIGFFEAIANGQSDVTPQYRLSKRA